MIIEGIIAAAVAGLVQLAQQAGQSIQQWITGPQGQQALQNLAQQFGPDTMKEICKRLGIDF